MKSIGSVSQRFEQELTGLVREAWDRDKGRISRDMRGLVMQYIEDAYIEGILDGGASPDQLTSEDYALVARLQSEQLAFVERFARDVQDATDDVGQQDSIRRRITLWAENVMRVGQRGWAQAQATRKQRIQWHTANDELVCPICGPLNDQIVEAGKPFAPGIYNEPAHPHCRCTTTPYVDETDFE